MAKLSIEDVVMYGVNDVAEKVWIDEDEDSPDFTFAGTMGGELGEYGHVLTLTAEPFKDTPDTEHMETTVYRFVELESLCDLLATTGTFPREMWRNLLITRLNISE